MLTSFVLDRAAQSEAKKNLELRRAKMSGFCGNKAGGSCVVDDSH